MKRQITLLILILFVGFFFYGCEEKEDTKDYITVNISFEGYVDLKNSTTGEYVDCPEEFQLETMRVDITKAGGENFNLFVETNEVCDFFSDGTVSFKLYRDQDIEAMAYFETVPSGYTQIRGIEILTWDKVFPRNDFGETYDWFPFLYVKWLFN